MTDLWDTFDEPGFVERLKKPDDEAWRELVEAKLPELKRAARSTGLRDPSLIENSVSEGLRKAFKSIKNYDAGKGSLRGWFHTIINNEARDEARQESRQRGGAVSGIISDERQRPEPASKPDFARQVELRGLFDLLKPVDQQRLTDVVEEIPDGEAAERDGISIATIRKQRSRARTNYRELLSSGSD